MAQQQTVSVEFDGPILDTSNGIEGEWTPAPGAIEALDRLLRSHSVVVLTHRSPQMVARWLAGYALPTTLDTVGVSRARESHGAILVTDRWVSAEAHISRRAVRWTTWEAALRAVRRMTYQGMAGAVWRAARYVAGPGSKRPPT